MERGRGGREGVREEGGREREGKKDGEGKEEWEKERTREGGRKRERSANHNTQRILEQAQWLS